MPDGPITILLVDDEFAALEVLGLLLRAEGFKVLEASDGKEALDVLGAQPVDLVITDGKMPRMDGFELCSRLRDDHRYSAIPVFLVSATYGPGDAVPNGFADFMSKPLQFSALLARLRQLLARRLSGAAND